MQELFDILGPELTPLITNLLLTLVGVLFTYLGIQAKKLMARVERSKEVQQIKESLENNKEIVKATVDYVEQIGAHLEPEKKFNLAKEKALEFANEKGLNITETELDVLIEQMVLNFNKGYNSDIHVEQNVIEAPEGDFDFSDFSDQKDIDESDVVIYPEKEEDDK